MRNRAIYNEGQAILADDLNKQSTLLQKGIMELMHTQLSLGGVSVSQGLMTARASATSVYVYSGTLPYAGTDSTNEPSLKVATKPDADSYIAYTIAAAHATLDRIDLVMVRASEVDDTAETRDIKNTLGVVAPASVPVRKNWGIEVLIKTGTAAASPAVPSVTSGYVAIAAIVVNAASGIPSSNGIIDLRQPRTNLGPNSSNPKIVRDAIPLYDTFYLAGVKIELASGDLKFSKTVGGGSTHADSLEDNLFAGFFWEMTHYFRKGYSLQIQDGAFNVWLIEPTGSDIGTNQINLQGGGTTERIAYLAGGSSPSRYRIHRRIAQFMNLGGGNFADAWQTVDSFTGFVTVAAAGSSTFALKVRRSPGDPKTYIQQTEGFSYNDAIFMGDPIVKPYWVRPLCGMNCPNYGTTSMNFALKMSLVYHRRYRVHVNAIFGVTAGQTFTFRIYEGPNTGNKLFERVQVVDSSAKVTVCETLEFVADYNFANSDRLTIEMLTTGGAAVTNQQTTGSGSMFYYNPWGKFPYLTVEEI